MAHLDVAHLDVAQGAQLAARPDSIKALVESITKPAYRRLLAAEPFLRRLVPIMIVSFLVVVGFGATIQALFHRQEAIVSAKYEIGLLADLCAERFNRSVEKENISALLTIQRDIARGLPHARPAMRFLITDTADIVIAASPEVTLALKARLVDTIGAEQLSTLEQARSNTVTIRLLDNSSVIATARKLAAPLGMLVVVSPMSDVLSAWREDTALSTTLFATTLFVLLITSFAFHWQSKRARETDLIYDTVRSLIDTALSRGRCGLWDWDLSRGIIFWSRSMFELLGLDSTDKLLTVKEVSALIHPDDNELYQLITEPGLRTPRLVDQIFRMRHARGGWVRLRLRCELVHQLDDPAPHLIGVAVDVAEHEHVSDDTRIVEEGLRRPTREDFKDGTTLVPGTLRAEPDFVSGVEKEPNSSAQRIGKILFKLAESLQRDATISNEQRLFVATAMEYFVVKSRYPQGLIRAFAAGLCLTGAGLVVIVLGISINSIISELAGSALLSIGLIATAISVIRGERLDELRSQ